MRIPRVFVDLFLDEKSLVELPHESSHYLSRVLRLPLKAPLRVFNGLGGEYAAHIFSIKKNNVTIKTDDFDNTDNSSALSIHLGISLSKGERLDFVIQKATELGVADISLLFSERTQVKLNSERVKKRMLHWQKISVSACEQCGCNLVPVIHAPGNLSQWLVNRDEEIKLIMQPNGIQRLQKNKPSTVALLVGPEGGFSEQEVDAANAAGFYDISFGPRLLRTETAPLVAISILQHCWGDLNFLG